MTVQCPVCSTQVPVDEWGFVAEHTVQGVLVAVSFTARCVGSGATPGQLTLLVEPPDPPGGPDQSAP